MGRLTGSLLAFVLALPTPGQARQPGRFFIGLSIGSAGYSTGARGTSDGGEELRFSVYRPLLTGLTAGYGGNRWRAEVGFRVGSPGLALRGTSLDGETVTEGSLLIVTENAYHLYQGTAAASIHLLRLRGGPSLRASLGATVDRWSAPDSKPYVLSGAQAGLALEVALTRTLVARAEAELGLSSSPFRAEDLPEGFRREATWRRSLAAVVAWRP